jgi:hypothetical protein
MGDAEIDYGVLHLLFLTILSHILFPSHTI